MLDIDRCAIVAVHSSTVSDESCLLSAASRQRRFLKEAAAPIVSPVDQLLGSIPAAQADAVGQTRRCHAQAAKKGRKFTRH